MAFVSLFWSIFAIYIMNNKPINGSIVFEEEECDSKPPFKYRVEGYEIGHSSTTFKEIKIGGIIKVGATIGEAPVPYTLTTNTKATQVKWEYPKSVGSSKMKTITTKKLIPKIAAAQFIGTTDGVFYATIEEAKNARNLQTSPKMILSGYPSRIFGYDIDGNPFSMGEVVNKYDMVIQTYPHAEDIGYWVYNIDPEYYDKTWYKYTNENGKWKFVEKCAASFGGLSHFQTMNIKIVTIPKPSKFKRATTLLEGGTVKNTIYLSPNIAAEAKAASSAKMEYINSLNELEELLIDNEETEYRRNMRKSRRYYYD